MPTLVSLAKDRNAEFVFSTKVKRILLNDQEASGVLLENGEQRMADIAVLTATQEPATGELGPEFKDIAKASLQDARSFSARVWSFDAIVNGPDRYITTYFAGDQNQSLTTLMRAKCPKIPPFMSVPKTVV